MRVQASATPEARLFTSSDGRQPSTKGGGNGRVLATHGGAHTHTTHQDDMDTEIAAVASMAGCTTTPCGGTCSSNHWRRHRFPADSTSNDSEAASICSSRPFEEC